MTELETMLDKAIQQPTIVHVLQAIRKAGYDVVKVDTIPQLQIAENSLDTAIRELKACLEIVKSSPLHRQAKNYGDKP